MWVSGPRMRGVLAQDLPAIDNTLRGVLSSSGEPHPNANDVDGAVLARARADKKTYPELLTGRCRLVVMAIETGGRWSSGAMDFVRQLARQSPRFLSHAVSDCGRVGTALDKDVVDGVFTRFASSLVEPSDKCATWCWTGGKPPSLAELLGQDPVVACARACLC